MTVSFLCVQFRNLLPSEDLLLFARARWNEAQARGEATDATLSITQTTSKLAPFEVELTVADASLRSVSRDANAIVAVEEAFARLDASRAWTRLRAPAHTDQIASGESTLAPTDTLLA